MEHGGYGKQSGLLIMHRVTEHSPKIFEIVVGYPCFDSVMASKNSLVQDFISIIGKLPQRWQNEWTRLRKDESETWVDDWDSPEDIQEGKLRTTLLS